MLFCKYKCAYMQNNPEVMNTTFSRVVELELSFIDQANNRYSYFLPDLSIRSYDFNSAIIEDLFQTGDTGTMIVTVILTVVTQTGRFYSNSSNLLGKMHRQYIYSYTIDTSFVWFLYS